MTIGVVTGGEIRAHDPVIGRRGLVFCWVITGLILLGLDFYAMFSFR